jgi:hypothetical protein
LSEARRSLRWGVAAIVFAVSAAAGAYVAASLAPERLRMEVERQVAAATGAPCRVATLRVKPGLPIEVEGREVALWDGALTVRRANARVSIAAALVGEVRLSRLALEGAVLSIRRGGEVPRDDRDETADAVPDAPEDLLAAIQDASRNALGALALADTLLIRGGRVEVAQERAPDVVAYSLEDIHARLMHSRLRGDSTLVAQARIRSGDAHRGLIEWNGSRREGEPLRLTIAATELDLRWLGSLAATDAFRPSGWLSGVADIELPDRERAKVALDLVAREFAWRISDERKPLFRVPRVSALADLSVEPDRISMHAARMRGGPIDAVIDGQAARPLDLDSNLDLSVRVDDVSVDELLALLTSTPAPWVEDAKGVLEAVDGGRVATFRARSRGPISDFGGGASTDSRGLPPGLELAAELEDLRIGLGFDHVIEGVSLRATWAGDKVVLRDAVGRRGGFDLPRLDFELDGVSRLLEADLDRRVPDSGDVLLKGLPLLISLFEPKPDSQVVPPHIDLRLSHLEHPAVLWPMRSLDLGFREHEDQLVGEIRAGTWAGVPFRGTLTWQSDPMHLTANLVALGADHASPGGADPPVDPPPPASSGLPLDGLVWAEGSFELGTLESDVWSHRRLSGRVRAAMSRVAFDGVEADTLPSGRVEGDLLIDLGREDALPYRAVFTASDLDADALFAQAKLGRGLVAGRVSANGDLRGRYERGVHPTAALNGEVHLTARDGHVRHDLPAVLALTLAGESLDLRSEREVVRYTSCESRLELTEGVARTDALEFEGPDLRMFGSGSLDLGHPPHAIDSEVVVFLFRPVDRVLGAMPIIGSLILGGSDNLFAAYFQLDGPWDAPTATYQPLRSLNTGPLRLVTGLPSVVRRGIASLGGTDASAPPVETPATGPPPGNGEAP